MITPQHLADYRVMYNPSDWRRLADQMGSECLMPVGAALAIAALCDEVERLHKLLEDDWK